LIAYRTKLSGFKVNIICSGVLATQLMCNPKPIPEEVEAGTQTQQIINVACLQQFSQSPTANIAFNYMYAEFIYHYVVSREIFILLEQKTVLSSHFPNPSIFLSF
jgi:hypothetical protein